MAAGSNSQHHSPRLASLGVRFLLLCGLSITLLIVDQRENHLEPGRRALCAAGYPLRSVVDSRVGLWLWINEKSS